MNIPVFRALKLGTEDEWVEGYFGSGNEIWGDDDDFEVIDPKTLAIHFNNMVDKNNVPIFASLSEDGVGGDILKNNDFRTTCKFDTETSSIYFEEYGSYIKAWEYATFEVIDKLVKDSK